MGQSGQEHLLACAERERELAARSFDEMVRATHFKLAHEYAMRAHGEDLLARGDDAVSSELGVR
jgi:hypothetical protein